MAKALSTQLKEAQKRIEELESKLKSAESAKDSYYSQKNELQQEINSIHAALDTLPGLPGKIYKPDDYSSRVELTVTARLFSWIANAAFSPQNNVKMIGAKYE